MRLAAVAVCLGFSVAATEPLVPPTPVTLKKANTPLGEVAAEMSKAPAGVAVTVAPQALKARCDAAFAGTPFWEALETAADKTNTRLVVRDGGRSVFLEPRPKGRELSAVSGPFRVVPRMVTGRLLLDGGTQTHEVQLEVHWEPRMPVYRIDVHPRITKATDDRGAALTATPGRSPQYPAAAVADMSVKLAGLTRDSKKIAVLAGDFRAVAAEKLLTFSFAEPAAKLPAGKTLDGVAATLKRVEQVGDTWEVELDLLYPEGQPVFESFEEQRWLRDNRVRLVSPNRKAFDPETEEVTASGRRVTAVYRFKGPVNPTAKGWAVVCAAPGPLVEVTVPFELRNIPLP